MQLSRAPSHSGFTLIEMLVYLALLSILMGGALLTAYQLLSGAGSTRAQVSTDEEANFLLRKIEWALSGASAVSSPAAGSSGPVLTVTKTGFGSNPIRIDLAAGAMELSRGGGTALPLNSTNVAVAGLTFNHIAAAGGAPEAVQATFTVNGRSYGLTKYLRQ